ncbi:MAG: MFS transporter [Deltaproteobacteria bacterium]|nr:MFS transporter [Deltaproteobacteria bacterium]
MSETLIQQDNLATSLAADNNAASLRGELTDHGDIVVRALFVILCYQGYAFAFLGVGAPFIAQSFHFDQSSIARMYAWISLNSVGALILSRMADRMGRRRIVMLSLLLTPLCSFAAAISSSAGLFILFEIIAYAGIGATFGSSFVMLAEALPIEKRSAGQGWANLAISTGGGGCVILAPLLAHYGISWRWLLAAPAAGIMLLPMMSRMLPESVRWEQAAARGASAGSHFYDIFSPAYRWRAVPLIIATMLGEASAAAVATWIYYHAISVVKLSPAQGSAILLVGGTISTSGLVLGVRMSERVGRVNSVAILGLSGIIGVLAFYWGPPTNFAWPMLWLLVAHTWFATTGRGTVVAANSAVTELFPTALRGTIMGWLTLCVAIAAIAAQVTIAVLAKPLGGLSNVVGWISLLSIPCVIIWWLFIDETRGLSLEEASRETNGR